MITERTTWFRNAGWGVFLHFLAIPPSTSDIRGVDADSWNRRVDAFDTDRLAAQLAAVDAGYVFLTLGQNSGYFCSPNAVYDELAVAGRCSRRNLFADLADSLARYRIPLLGYLPSHAPMSDAEAVRRLGFVPEWDFGAWSPVNQEALRRDGGADPDPKLSRAQRNWEAVIRCWSERWGDKLNGWWFDGCYYYRQMYLSGGEPDFHSFAAAARAGNPEAIVAFNCGVKYPPVVLSSEEDFCAGECNDPKKMQESGIPDPGIQRHVLTYAGQTWGKGPLRFSGEELHRHTAAFQQLGAVTSWDLPFREDGTLAPETVDALLCIGEPCGQPAP